MIGTEMAVNKRQITFVVHSLKWLLILLSSYISYGTETDYLCLKLVRQSFEDPNNYLSNWDFTNTTEGSICKFNGIECWQEEESMVLTIKLTYMGLKGQFPLGLAYCSNITELYLSGNSLNGSLPSNISHIIPFVTVLDLSDNDFSGPIPLSLANCTYMSVLNLGHNRFTRQIPLELGDLSRLRTFYVANNQLFGLIPQFNPNTYTANKDSFANNAGLCGFPLGPCRIHGNKSLLAYIVGGATACSFIILTVAAVIYKYRKKGVRTAAGGLLSDRWLLNMNHAKDVKVSMFDDSVPKLTCRGLMKATKNFSNDNIIGSEITGTRYEATLRDGTLLMVKRLHKSQQTEKDFLSEMTALGSLKHQNLVPLLGFCSINKERFLIYEHMANGNVSDQLHPPDSEPIILGWPLRLKIGIRAAQGLAWLEQNRIHVKISSKCILLDQDYEPKFYELGMTSIPNPSQTHFSTFARGEIGDLGFAVLEQSNVHSFGTVLLELITGEKPFQVASATRSFKGSLVEWVNQLSRMSSEVVYSAIDKSLLGKGVDDELFQFMSVACSCVSDVPKERPTMNQVCRLLKTIGERYNFT